MKTYGETTISPTLLTMLLHPTIVADAQSALADWADDGDVPEDSYIQTVGIQSIDMDEDGTATVNWELIYVSPSQGV